MNVEQFKNMLWRELGRLPKPIQNHTDERPVFSIAWHDDKHGEDWINVVIEWWPPNASRMKFARKDRAAITTRLVDIPEGTSLESFVHTVCAELAKQIEVKNSLDYSYP